jgi:hypothetical protein
MVCRVCLLNVKRSAVICAQCSLIAHSKCAGNSPPTCDLRAQLLLYAQYAEKGNPSSAYANPLDGLTDSQVANLPLGPMSEVPYVTHTPRSSFDGLLPQSPPAQSTPAHPPTAFKFLNPFKRSRALSPEPGQASSKPSTPLPPPKDEKPRGKKLKRNPDRRESVASSSTSPNTSSLRSAVTEDSSTRQHGRQSAISDAGTRESDDAPRSARVVSLSGASIVAMDMDTPTPGKSPADMQPKKKTSNGCNVQ